MDFFNGEVNRFSRWWKKLEEDFKWASIPQNDWRDLMNDRNEWRKRTSRFAANPNSSLISRPQSSSSCSPPSPCSTDQHSSTNRANHHSSTSVVTILQRSARIRTKSKGILHRRVFLTSLTQASLLLLLLYLLPFFLLISQLCLFYLSYFFSLY